MRVRKRLVKGRIERALELRERSEVATLCGAYGQLAQVVAQDDGWVGAQHLLRLRQRGELRVCAVKSF